MTEHNVLLNQRIFKSIYKTRNRYWDHFKYDYIKVRDYIGIWVIWVEIQLLAWIKERNLHLDSLSS